MKTIHAYIQLVPTDQGGRQSPIRSGYIGNLEIADRITAAGLVFPDDKELAPGQSSTVVARLPNFDYIAHLLTVGSELRLVEGPRKIAHGKVLQVSMEGSEEPGDAGS